MKKCFFVSLFLMTVFTSYSQNLIGYDAKYIKKYMSANNREMNLERVSNKSFSYLKYSDRYDTQTMLFFLSPDSVCTNIKIVYNSSVRSSKIIELDSTYQRTSENMWIDKQSGKRYFLKLVDDEWSFSIIIEPEK